MKTSFVVREDMVTLFESLDDVSAGQLIKALCAHQKGKESVIENGILNAAFTMFCGWLDEDSRKYEEKCRKNSENIRKRWNKSDVRDNTNVYDRIPTDTSALPDDTKNTDNDSDNDNDNKKKTSPTESKKKSRAAFTPPTPEEVREYEVQTGLSDEAHAFVDHYTSNGWLVGGKTKMKDWKSARRNWERNKEKFGNRDAPKQEYHNRYNDFPQRNNDYKQIEEEWIRRAFGA